MYHGSLIVWQVIFFFLCVLTFKTFINYNNRHTLLKNINKIYLIKRKK